MSYLARKRRRDIKRQRWQFLAVAATVAVGAMMFTATFDSYRNLTVSYEQTYERLAFADMTIVGGDEQLVDTLAGITGVQAITVRHSADVPITIGHATLKGRLIGMPPVHQPDVNKIDVVDGEYLAADGEFEAVAEIHVAETFDLRDGSAFTVVLGPGQEFALTGVATSAEYLWPAPSTQEIIVDPEQFGVFFVDEAVVSQLPSSVAIRETLVLYEDGVVTEDIDALVQQAASDAGATSIATQADQPSNATLQLDVGAFKQMAIAFPILFLTAAAMAVYVLLARIVFSQRSIIGTLRASGISTRAVRRHYLGFGLLIGTAGSAVGVVLGVAGGALLTSVYTSELDIPDTVVVIRPFTIIVGLLFGVATGIVSAYFPARSASKVAPAEAMRGEAPLMTGGRSLLERVVPPISRLPVRTRMMLRGIGRSKRRSFSTVLGVVLALILVLASGAMIDSVIALIDKQFNEVALQDATVIFSEPLTAELLEDLDAIEGVTRSEPVADFRASITRNGETLATTLQGFVDDTQMHGWTNPSQSLSLNGAIVARGLGDTLGLVEGDLLQIDLPAYNVSIVLELVEFVNEPLGVPIYATIDVITEALRAAGVENPEGLMSDPTVASAMTLFDPALSRTTTITAIEGVSGVLAVQDARTLYDSIQSFLGLFYAFLGVMLVFGGLMAFSLMFNTMSVNIAERSTEFATLKANGMADKMIARMIVSENLLLTAFGIIPGVVLGLWLSALFLSTFNNDSFTFDFSIRPVTIAIAVLAMFAVALLSLIPGVRSIKRLDIAAVARERAA